MEERKKNKKKTTKSKETKASANAAFSVIILAKLRPPSPSIRSSWKLLFLLKRINILGLGF